MTSKPRYILAGISYRRSGHSQKLLKLKDCFKGQPMLVVGSGPSLNQTPLDRFVGVPAIGMNKIDILFERTPWRPSMIVVVNNLVVRQHSESFANSEVPVYVSWKARWFLQREHRDRVNYFYQTPTTNFGTDFPQGISGSATVTYACLQMAYYMGADPVILFGIDHSFSKKSTSHNIEKRSGPDKDHFDPNYFAAGSLWGVPNLDMSETVFQKAKIAFEADGRRIVDATLGGQLQVFPKINLDEALALCRRKPNPS